METATANFTDATLTFGRRALFTKLNLTVVPGEFIAILGPNGAGKSSLLKTLLGVQPLNSGSVSVLGQQPRQVSARVGYIPQQKAFDRDIPMTGRDLVNLGVSGTQWWWRPMDQVAHDHVESALREVGATRFAHKPLGRLSGGEQQRLRIAQAIVANPQLLLCDEPLLSLDIASQQNVTDLINVQRQKGTSVIFVTHEINPILPYVDRVLYLVGGKWAVGTPKQVLTRESLSELYGTHIDVVHVHNRIIVVGAPEHAGAEPRDTHHHQGEHE